MNSDLPLIRSAETADRGAIMALHREAFGEAEGAEVSQLADDLIDDPTAAPLLSLVAEESGTIIGHVLFTAARVVGGGKPVPCRIMAPAGVVPSAQGRGIGGRMIREGLRRLGRERVGLVFVLGHPGYYSRFGFTPAGALGLEAPYPIPAAVADAWMVLELEPGNLGRAKGAVQVPDVLNQPEHWRE